MNADVLSILEDKVETMSDKVRVCCLMFNDVNQKIDCIGGFEDLGSRGWRSSIAHHAPWSM